MLAPAGGAVQMGLHRGPRSLGVVLGDQLEDRFVLAQGHRSRAGAGSPAGCRSASSRSSPSREGRARCGWRAIARWNSRSSRGSFDIGVSLCMRSWISRELGDVFVGRALGGEAGEVNLEDGAHFVHLLEVERSATKKQAHRLAHGVRVDGAATRNPLPERTSITPFVTRARIASRTTVRETPNCSPSSRSDGSRSPTLRRSTGWSRASCPRPCPRVVVRDSPARAPAPRLRGGASSSRSAIRTIIRHTACHLISWTDGTPSYRLAAVRLSCVDDDAALQWRE